MNCCGSLKVAIHINYSDQGQSLSLQVCMLYAVVQLNARNSGIVKYRSSIKFNSILVRFGVALSGAVVFTSFFGPVY